ncbi:MAG: tRNA (adenosine(37)-N6)-threonylcarbamoyltransferase complex dimerization subunit type 1 TsaB [Ardenticatenia bacterium]|jgi:tRNA threonylcarbamoyladenosine biosynthesis protein TsaB|nr:MAG: tRNA (adenosine(37)-N6)-threonylcarbamoyltransferase complex dimerization subunit type 1 TsaB [Ardenticatenia bacterium]
MMILAIDTATSFAGLALWEEDHLWAEEAWHTHLNHSVELMPRIQRMLATHRLGVERLTAIAVALGPGSFTGVRAGLAAAKGLVLPYRIPLVGVSTLDVTAYPFQHSDLPVWAVISAGRGRIGAACYQRLEGAWRQVVAPQLTTFDALCARTHTPALFVGEIVAAEAALLHRRLGDKAVVPPPALRSRRAGYLAELAAARLANNDVDDAMTLAPIYLQAPEGHALVAEGSSAGQ